MDSSLCETRVTGDEIQKLISKSPHLDMDHQKIIQVNAELLGDQGATSKVFRATLTWSSSNDKNLPKSIVVKSIGNDSFDKHLDPAMFEKLKEMKEKTKTIHDTECCLYSIEGLEKAAPMPKCYAAVKNTATEDGIIILEDLGDKGNVLPKTVSFGEGLNENQVDNLLNALVTLHSWSLNTNVDWMSIVPRLDSECGLSFFADAASISLAQSKKEYLHIFENVDETKAFKLINKYEFAKLFGDDPRPKFNLPMVLVHGDIQPLNFLFEKNANGEMGDEIVALVDWQISHPGCGAEDVARLLYMCISPKNRKESGDQIIKKYVELFNKKVEKPENRITYENFKTAVDEFFAYYGIMFGFAVYIFAMIPLTMTGITEEERAKIRQDLIDRTIENYEDSVKMLGW